MKWTAEFLLSLRETTSYPALLSRLERVPSGSVPLEPEELLQDLLEARSEEQSDENRFSHLLEEGEIGAARQLFSLLDLDSRERVRILRHASSYKQELEAMLRRLMGLLLLLKETEGEALQRLRGEAEALSQDQVLLESRPGFVLRKLEPIVRQLETLCHQTLEDLRTFATSLQEESQHHHNRDVSLALKRLHPLLESKESLPDAQQMVLLLQRAVAGGLNPEDLRQLHQEQVEKEERLVRPWSDFQEFKVESAEEILQLLQRKNCPVYFKSENYQQNALALFQAFRLKQNRLRVERASEKLFDFLGLTPGATVDRSKHGVRLSLRFEEPRIPAFRAGRLQTRLELLFPVTAEHKTLQRMLQSLPQDVLPVVYYPGALETSLKEMFRLRKEVAHFDNLDLLRLVECRLEHREHAFQQILLPRCPISKVNPWQLSGPVALEMFRGRHHVIERLRAPRGGTVLFSGRMMGKSSILDKLSADLVSEGRLCIKLSNVSGDLLTPLVQRVAELFSTQEKKRLLQEDRALHPTSSLTPSRRAERRRERLARLRQAIGDLLQKDPRLHLSILVDEADHFAAEDSELPRNESLAWLLRDLEFNHVEQLRVVFAGFQTIHHQVISGNSAFANWFGLVQLSILESQDASRLVREPFADFGFLFPSNAGIQRILDFTGQHPLLIQETCARLMGRMIARRQRGQKHEVIQVHAGDVESICRDDQLRDRVHQVLSLNLNQFPRLKLMVYLILYGTTFGDSQPSFSLKSFRLEDLKALLLEWYEEQLNEYFDEKSISALVQELMTLGLLVRRGETYEFVNTTFASMLIEETHFESVLENLLATVMNPDSTEARRFPTLLGEDLERLRHSRGQHTLFTGLKSSLKTTIASSLFKDSQRTLLLPVHHCDRYEELVACLKSHLEERRKTLSVSDLLLKHGIQRLVLDGLGELEDPALLLEAAEELRERDQQLLVFGGAALARSFTTSLFAGSFDLMTLRRLRPKDIKNWGARLSDRDDFQLVLDQRSCEELARITGGFFSLVAPFQQFCQSKLQRAREYLPGREQVKAYGDQLSVTVLEETLLDSLTSLERSVLQSLFLSAEKTDVWQFDFLVLEGLLLERTLESDELDALDLLQNLHLLETAVVDGKRQFQLRPDGPLRKIFTTSELTP